MTQRLFLLLLMMLVCAFLFHGIAGNAIAGQGTDPAGNVTNVQPTPPGRDVSPEAYGPTSETVYIVSANAMAPLVSDTTWNVGDGLTRYRTGGSIWFQGQVHIPSGALLTGIELDACDTHVSASVDVFLHRCPVHATACDTLASASTGGAAAPGCNFFEAPLNETVDNFLNNYTISVAVTGTDPTTSFQAVRIYHMLQISPAPVTATFTDVDVGAPFFQEIEALAASGITTGYPDGTFKPNNPVTRGAVAAFLARALGLHWPN